ncbi:zinc knuckle CX2CX4HX4C containing protein [Tanacetum coccineum]
MDKDEVITKEIRVLKIRRNDDKYVDLAKDGENEGSDITTNEVLENSDHNEPNIEHSEKDELDEHTVNVEGNDNYSSNYVNVESDEELGVKCNDKIQKPLSYAKMVEKDEIPKDLNYIPTRITKSAIEVVLFDEMLVKKGSERWNLTVCGQFVGFPMHINEMRYNIRRMWRQFGVIEINDGKNGYYMFKFRNEDGLNRVTEKG